MRTVALSGASGFLGWHLAVALRDEGWRVRGLVRPGSTRPIPEGIERVETPLEAEALARAIEGSEVFVHGAAVTRAPTDAAFHATNVEGTRAAVLAANAVGARLVYVSSQAAGGPGTVAAPRNEDDAPRPVNGYGRSKLAAEQEVRNHARVPWTILRPSSIYGPRDRGFLPLYRMAARGLFPLVAHPDAAFSLIHVDDAVRGIRAAFAEPATGATVFLAHPDAVRGRDLLATLARVFGRTFRPAPVPGVALRVLARAGDIAWKFGRQPLLDSSRFLELRGEGFVCSVAQAAERLGFRAEVPLENGVARTARWYQEKGWL